MNEYIVELPDSMTPEHIPMIENNILEERRAKMVLSDENRHKDVFSNRHERAENALDVVLSLLKSGASVVEWHDSGVLVNYRYVVATQQNKWRVKGRGKWYYYKTIEHLVENYILKSKNKKEEE